MRTWAPPPPREPAEGDQCLGYLSLTQGAQDGPHRDLVAGRDPVSTHVVGSTTATYYERDELAPSTVALAWDFAGQFFIVETGSPCLGEDTSSLERVLQFANELTLPSR
jgi:hypothetical protein